MVNYAIMSFITQLIIQYRNTLFFSYFVIQFLLFFILELVELHRTDKKELRNVCSLSSV